MKWDYRWNNRWDGIISRMKYEVGFYKCNETQNGIISGMKRDRIISGVKHELGL